MTRQQRPKGSGPTYSPLLGRRVECAMLSVSRFSGRKLKPAYDEDGRAIEVPADAELRELRRRILAPGRYRVSARAPTGEYVAHSDFDLEPDDARPSHGGRTSAPAPAAAMHMPSMDTHERGYLALLHETANNLREQLRDNQMRAERDIRYERERADTEVRAAKAHADEAIRLVQERAEVEVRASRERANLMTAKAHEAEVRFAGCNARLEAREMRLAELETQIAELKSEIEHARDLAAELRSKSSESDFSPFDALMQMDQAFDLLSKNIDRFSKKQ